MPKREPFIECNATEREDDVVLDYDEIKANTKKSALLVINGDEHWIPFSQTTGWWKHANQVQITKWIAEQKDLA